MGRALPGNFSIKLGVLQGSVLCPLKFLIYMNDLLDNIQSPCKIFPDDTSLFSHVSDKLTSQSELNNYLHAISIWDSQCKIQFNPDPIRQLQEIYFSKKGNNVSLFLKTFKNINVVTCFLKSI